MGILPCVPAATGTVQKQRSVLEPLPHFPPKHNPTHQADFGVSVFVRGFVVW